MAPTSAGVSRSIIDAEYRRRARCAMRFARCAVPRDASAVPAAPVVSAGRTAHRASRNSAYILPRMNPPSTPQPYLSQGNAAPVGAEPETGRAVESDDEALVRRMAEGDDQALGVLYDRWQAVVHGVVSRMLRQPDDVEDVVEETFWQAWRQASRFDRARGAVPTWLLTIARSRALDRVRALRRRREEPLEDDDGQVVGQQVAEGDPGQEVEASERRRLVVAA